MTKFIAEHPSVLAENLDSEVVQFRQYFGGRSKFDKIVWTGTQKISKPPLSRIVSCRTRAKWGLKERGTIKVPELLQVLVWGVGTLVDSPTAYFSSERLSIGLASREPFKSSRGRCSLCRSSI